MNSHHIWCKYQDPLVSPTGPLRVTEQVRIVLCHLLNTWKKKKVCEIKSELSETVKRSLCVCVTVGLNLWSYLAPVARCCCSDGQGWSSSARCHGNATEGSELCSSPELRRSSVSPRHWSDKGTERMTPSEEGKRALSEHCEYFCVPSSYFIKTGRRLPCRRTPAPHPRGKGAGQQPPRTTAFVSEPPA